MWCRAASRRQPAEERPRPATVGRSVRDPLRTVQRHLGAISRCPAPARATAALAGVMGVEREHLLVTNGGAEAITLTGAFLGGSVEEPRLLPVLPHWWASPMRSTSTGLLGHDGKWHRRLVTVS